MCFLEYFVFLTATLTRFAPCAVTLVTYPFAAILTAHCCFRRAANFAWLKLFSHFVLSRSRSRAISAHKCRHQHFWHGPFDEVGDPKQPIQPGRVSVTCRSLLFRVYLVLEPFNRVQCVFDLYQNRYECFTVHPNLIAHAETSLCFVRNCSSAWPSLLRNSVMASRIS